MNALKLRSAAAMLSVVLLSLLNLAAADTAPGGVQPPGPLAELLPAKPFKASLMRLAFEKSSAEISARFNDAMAKSPEWFKSYLAENAGVTPLPYHPNFGISEAEYKTMLANLEKHHLEKVADVVVVPVPTPEGAIVLDCPDLGKNFSGISIDLRSGKLSTPWLDIDSPDVKSSGSVSDGNPYGDWSGAVWRKVVFDRGRGDYKSVSFYVGRSKTAGASFMQLRVKVMEANKIKLNFETILQYP